MITVGIIGAGSFGIFLAEKLDPYFRVIVYSHSGKLNKWAVEFDELKQADFLIPSIPLDAYETVLKKLKPILNNNTVVVDICSVKQKPVEIIQRILPSQPMVATHPLFGPESAYERLDGHTLVICPEVSDGIAVKDVIELAKNLKLKVIEMTTEGHDEEMAVVQGLTFFIARVLNNMGLHHQKLETPSFKRLLHLAELEAHHSRELFSAIQAGNPSLDKVRQNFIEEVDKLNDSLKC
jgi:prephenate dehydrogenase